MESKQTGMNSKRDWPHISVCIIISSIILLGFLARSYHLDYPSIGYHNVKENEYIGMAKFMLNDHEFFHRKSFNLGTFEVPYFEEYPQLPLIPWFAVIIWLLTGVALWPVRALIVLSSCACVYLLYKISLSLQRSFFLAICSAALFAFFPLSVFFGRNIQPEAIALAFFLLGTLLFLKWKESLHLLPAFGMAFCFGVGSLLKLTFLILLVPLIPLTPYNRLFQKENIQLLVKTIQACLLGFIPFILWNATAPFINKISTVTEGTRNRIRLADVFTSDYWITAWPSIHSYIHENFTWAGSLLILAGFSLFGFLVHSKEARVLSVFLTICAIGIVATFPSPFQSATGELGFSGRPLVFAALVSVSFLLIAAITALAVKEKSSLATYIGGSILSLVPYVAVFSDFVSQHNYYQYPFLPLACLSASLPLLLLKNMLGKPLGQSWAYAPSIAALLLLIPGFVKNTSRMFDTQFFGCDVAGSFLKKSMPEGERFFLFGSHQSVGVGNYAERVCIFSGTFPQLTISMESFLKYKEKFGINWVCIDALNMGLPIANLDPKVLEYLQNNYGLAAIGVLRQGERLQLSMLILKSPGSFNLSLIGESPLLRTRPTQRTTYKLTSGQLDYELFSP